MGDGAFLIAAILAGLWAKQASLRIGRAAVVLLVAIAETGGGYAYAALHQTGAKAPESVLVDGKPMSLEHGRYFVFFFDPECSHCRDAGRHMSTYHWKSGVTIIGVPTRMARFAPGFMTGTHLNGQVTSDLDKLKTAFPLPGDPPYGVYVEDGRQVGAVQHYDDEDDGKEPAATLRQLGLID